MKKVNIITATLNRQSLKDACESINNQTYKNWHHYVIGDGVLPKDYNHQQRTTLAFTKPLGAFEPSFDKPDGTPNPILRWALKHLELEDYVCFLDDDNTYEPLFIEVMLNTLLENHDKGIVLCALNDLRDDDIHDGYQELGRCDNSAFLVKTSIAKEVGFRYANPKKDNIEDFKFIKDCSDKYGWTRVPLKLVNFGVVPYSTPSPKRREMYS